MSNDRLTFQLCLFTCREILDDEEEVLEQVMDAIFQCNLSSLPTAMLMDTTWPFFQANMTYAPAFIKCLKSSGIWFPQEASMCYHHISALCPLDFKWTSRSLSACRSLLWNNNSWISNSAEWNREYPGHSNEWAKYFHCLNAVKDRVHHCAVHHLDEPCRKSHVRAVKTVRSLATVDKYLLAKYDNFRLIHIFRDPKKVVFSQDKWTWTASTVFPTTNAEVYCGLLSYNYDTVDHLAKKYPERVLQIFYDKFMGNISQSERDLFKFLGYDSIPDNSQEYLIRHRKPHPQLGNRTYITSLDDLDDMNKFCSTVQSKLKNIA